jgi:hypothetical protein
VNALAHYQVLVWLVRAEITRIVQDDKRGLISELDERTLVHEQGYLNVQSDPKLFANSTPTNAPVNAPATILTHVSANLPPDVCPNFIPANHTCPSEYLRSQCPLCFGGNHTDTPNMP